MFRALTCRIPIIRVVFRIGPVTLRFLEDNLSRKCEPWPRSVPKEVEVSAMIDTGASVSIIDSYIIETMRLEPRGYCPTSGFDSSKEDSGKVRQYPNYELGLTILDADDASPLLTIRTGQIVGHHVANKRFEAIIGMDVLKHCHFHLDGPADRFEIIAPESHVDEISSVTVTEA